MARKEKKSVKPKKPHILIVEYGAIGESDATWLADNGFKVIYKHAGKDVHILYLD